jgi:hypothetical protein
VAAVTLLEEVLGMGKKRSWEPMRLRYVGHVGDVLRGGGGKLSTTGGDTGDTRKPKGGG